MMLESIDWVQSYRDIERKRRDQDLNGEKKGYTGRKTGTHPTHDLAEYTGEFEHPGYGTMAIRLDSTGGSHKLFMKLNDIERPLEHFHYDTFQVPENPLDSFEKLRITFPTSQQGEISTVQANLDANVKEIVFTRAPEKRMFEPPFLRQFTGKYDAPGHPWTVAPTAQSTLPLISPHAPPPNLITRHAP